MRYLVLSLLLCVACSACTARRQRVPHASPEEAAAVEFPYLTLPKEGLQRLDGNRAASIQLAMEDFLSGGPPPAGGPVLQEPCLWRHESYEVTSAPMPEGVMLVRFDLNTDACKTSDQLIDITTYAIDIRTMRILSLERLTRPNPARILPSVTPPQPSDTPPPSSTEAPAPTEG